MLTLVEAISLAGDRNKQNDDAYGAAGASAWVIDGATDLYAPPRMNYPSDAAWMATELNANLFYHLIAENPLGVTSETLREEFRIASEALYARFTENLTDRDTERWALPTASVLAVSDNDGDLVGADLGDSRCFALDANGVGYSAGSRENGTDDEQQRARDASKRAGAPALLRDADTVTMLRSVRARHNLPENGYWVFGLQPECADHARVWTLPLKRPAHVLLCTDGFSALVDRYKVYDAGSLVTAALDKGLQELGRELRAIETADAGGAAHPRFKKSDDATAVLLRLTLSD
jgi:serine/threonine protein phosphatase PrpC